MNNILDQFNEWVQKQPNDVLFCFLDVNGEEIEKYTYQEFQNRTLVIASQLSKKTKLKPNDRVVLAYEPGLEIICAFFACVRLGLIPVPVYPPSIPNFDASLRKMIYIAEDCEAAAVLTSRKYYWSFQLNMTKQRLVFFKKTSNYLSKIKWIRTDEFQQADNIDFPGGFNEILFLQYTSGSTNDPKGVIVTHETLLSNCEAVVDHKPIGVSWLPQYHDMGLIGYYLFFALKGGTTYGFSPFDFINNPALWLKTITKYRGTATSAPNFAYQYCLREDKIPQGVYSGLDLSSLRFVMTAAEMVRAETYFKFIERFEPYGLNRNAFFSAYGLAENTLAVSNYGRKALSLNKAKLNHNIVKIEPHTISNHSLIDIMSCGKPIPNCEVRIVNPDTLMEVEGNEVGEIWVGGASKCLGYWGKEEQSKETFEAAIKNDTSGNTYLRTGDLGFLHEEEVYICGRIKDMIIIRGVNFYPHDIEKIVTNTSDEIRKGCVAAFGVQGDQGEELIIAAEIKNPKNPPNISEIVRSIGKNYNIYPDVVFFIPPKAIPKTSSGKISRNQCKKLWLENKFKIIHSYSHAEQMDPNEDQSSLSIGLLKERYNLRGNESITLFETGLDSLAIVELISSIKRMIQAKGVSELESKLDIRLFQSLSIADLFSFIGYIENTPDISYNEIESFLNKFHHEQNQYEFNLMQNDRILDFEADFTLNERVEDIENILLIGGTGFFGPFLLISLLEQTDNKIYVLVRAISSHQGKERLRSALKISKIFTPELENKFEERVAVICGDLGKEKFGLNEENWNFLAREMHVIYHNGAAVNYVLNYNDLKNVNIFGTKEVLKLCFEQKRKILNYISTTFIFGWSVKDFLYETDFNDEMNRLDFGYSQTKWVAEQLVRTALEKGLDGRIFRPSLISPSEEGGGYNYDIAIRLIAFIINHRKAVIAENQLSFMPANIAANDTIAISVLPNTLNKTFHVTADAYYNIMDVTEIISDLTGIKLEYFEVPEFVNQLKENCTSTDLVYPLLDFFTRSAENISAMKFKRYDSSNYQYARNKSSMGKQDIPLVEVVRGIVNFLKAEGVINLATEPVTGV